MSLCMIHNVDTGGCIKTQTTRSYTQCDVIYSKIIVRFPCFEGINKNNKLKTLCDFLFKKFKM